MLKVKTRHSFHIFYKLKAFTRDKTFIFVLDEFKSMQKEVLHQKTNNVTFGDFGHVVY